MNLALFNKIATDSRHKANWLVRIRRWCPDSKIHRMKSRVAAGRKLLILVACSSQKFAVEFLGQDTRKPASLAFHSARRKREPRRQREPERAMRACVPCMRNCLVSPSYARAPGFALGSSGQR